MPEPIFGFERIAHGWSGEQLADTLCEKAYGKDFRLPTRAELIELAEQGAVLWGGWFWRDSPQAIGVLEFEPGRVLPSDPPQIIPDRICLVPRARYAGILCVNHDISAAPPLSASDAEVRACVSQIEKLSDPRAEATSALPAREIELVLIVRRACERQDVKFWSETIARFEKRGAMLGPASRELAVEQRDMLVRLSIFERAVASPSVELSCEQIRTEYEKSCTQWASTPASYCMSLQLRSAECRGDKSARKLLESVIHQFETRFTTLRAAARARDVLSRVIPEADHCVNRLATPWALKLPLRNRLTKLAQSLDDGVRGPDSALGETDIQDFWACSCPLADMQCGIDAVERPAERCVSAPANQGP